VGFIIAAIAIAISCIVLVSHLVRARRKPERRPRAAPDRSQASRQAEELGDLVLGKAPPDAITAFGATLDLSRLEPPPEVPEPPKTDLISEEALPEIMEKVDKVSRSLATRRSVLRELSTSGPDPKELTKVVVGDPALAGQVLKTVNSAFYGLRYPVASVFRAVLLLGHLEVRNIIWRACIAEAYDRGFGPIGRLLDNLWKHSFAVSRVAYTLAKTAGVPEPDDVATAGLLHDIGKIFYLKTRPCGSLDVYAAPSFSTYRQLQLEEAELQLCHPALGRQIVRRWGMPPETCRVVSLHHEPSYMGPEEILGDCRGVAVVYLADILCHLAMTQHLDDDAGGIYLPVDGWLRLLGAADGIAGVCDRDVLKALSIGLPEEAEERETESADLQWPADEAVWH
jgi:putative nucleotidyltransferase with HDIG domain